MSVSKDQDGIALETQDVAPAPAKPATAHDEIAPAPPPVQGRDKAAQFLKEAGHTVVVTPDDNRRVLRKIDLRILPLILFVYCLQSLDKTTLSYASVFGLIEDTNLVKDEFSWLGSIVYVAQLVFQPMVAYLLVRFPIGKFISTMVFFWGAILCCMAAAHNFTGLMITRLLLGAFEASVGQYALSLLGTLC
jgi:sugar phosphate permease